jgi:SAM-dependent MidA family methyltransferase
MHPLLHDNCRAMPASIPAGLPTPDNDSREHSARCAAYLRRQIDAAGGAISFAAFMQHALYAPGLGYYAAGATKFGADGDFVTAPEVSPLFARVLARQCMPVLNELGGGTILEFGAGSGRLAVDLLRALESLSALPEHYEILEVSADLRERQLALIHAEIPQLSYLVRWRDGLPDRHRGVMIANEVLDALPVERFRVANPVQQCCVENSDGGFRWTLRPAPASIAEAVAGLQSDLDAPLADGFTSEVSPGVKNWTSNIVASLEAGMIYLFDYGLGRREYYAPDRSDGWLRCHFRHHAHNDPLIFAGIQDITCWVDFTAVAEAAVAAGAEIAGYVAQAQFLLAGGLPELLQDIGSLPLEQQVALSSQVKMLTLPAEMGERFKCLGLRRGLSHTPAAFSVADRTHTL